MSVPKAYISSLAGCLFLAVSCILGGSAQAQVYSWGSLSFLDQTNSRPINLDDIVNSDFLKDSTYTYLFQELNSTWHLDNKEVFEYDQQGRADLSTTFNFESGEWIPDKKLQHVYSETFLLAYEYEYNWSKLQNKWNLALRRTFGYNYVGLENEVVEEIFRDNVWEKYARLEKSYNSSNKLEMETNFSWNIDETDWMAETRVIYNYNEDNYLSQEVHQTWDDSLDAWINLLSRDYEYDEQNNLILSTRSNWNSEENRWVSFSFTALEYDEKGQLQGTEQVLLNPSNGPLGLQAQDANYDEDGNLGEIIHSSYNWEEGVWEDYKKQVHFWSQRITGNLDELNTEIHCLFANPYIVGLPWYCDNLKTDQQYRFELYDLQGRLRYTDSFRGGDVFKIRGNLQNGVYLARVSGGLDVFSTKVIIRD